MSYNYIKKYSKSKMFAMEMSDPGYREYVVRQLR